MVGWRDADRNELLSAHFCARRRRRFGLRPDPDFRALCRPAGLGRVSRILTVPAESALAAPISRPGPCGGGADGARAGHPPAAPERAVDRFRDADFGALAEAAKIRRRTRHQIVFRSAAI